MCLNIGNLFLFLSPLEQFEISSYNTLENYITTFPVDFLEKTDFVIFFEKPSVFFIINAIFIFAIFLGLDFLFKDLINFSLLYLFILSILTCINVNAYSDFVYQKLFLYEGSVKFNWVFITNKVSFINIYSVIFCFIFILFIMYLLYYKNTSNNRNTIIPTLYQIIGETVYKVSLNLFHSILGKNLSHPEFFIKINTIFIFLIISNVQGMIPYMSTLTSALSNTLFIALALFISILTTIFDKKGINFFLNLFMPSGCPILLVPLLIPIEIISFIFRVISISVRLFANMMAGHILLKVIVGFSWIIVFLGNTSLINLFPIAILFILTLLEFGVAFIQAYIFTILSCMYLRDIFVGH